MITRLMNVLARVKSAWHKNSYELLGLFNGGVPEFVKAGRPAALGRGVPVFHYHVVTAAALGRDLDYLRVNGYRTLNGDEFLAHLNGTRVFERPVLLTFDDGPRNFYDVAYPELRRRSAHALAFVAPNMHFESAEAEILRSPQRPMTWAELREIHSHGLVDIESHTLESRYVPKWPEPRGLDGIDPEIESRYRSEPRELGEDLRLSKQMLEANLPGKRVKHLAFPAYDGSERAVELARDAGYEACHWGILPARGLNLPGDSAMHVARLSSEFICRLPGRGRASRADVLRRRWDIVRRRT